MNGSKDTAPKAVGMISGMRNAAAYVGVSPRRLWDWIQDGKVRVIRHSQRKCFFRPSDLLKAVEEIGAEYEARHS